MSAKKPKKKAQKDGKKDIIKKEGEEMHTLSHYLDDRVELLKQIFSTLKPKTIKSLAPEFLKKSSIEELQELCLNEILGISKKRLNSVINGTKCPSDTESSSDDSDVENIEEHISLEEISSDSEDGGGTKKKTAGNKSKKRSNAKKPDAENGHGMEISVLELLELQARARAIRSQLALEPVTKIEVDSDDDSPKTSSKEEEKRNLSSTKNNKAANVSNSNKLIDGSKTVNGNVNAGAEQKPPKRIKLKRNFRKANATSDNEENNTDNFGARSDSKEENEKVETANRKKEPSPEKVEKTPQRSPSPDVITILPSPETFCISDSSEDEHTKEQASQKKAVARKITEKYTSDLTETMQSKENEKNDIIQELAEVEDGEIIEQEEENKSEQKSHNNSSTSEETSNMSNNNEKMNETVDLSNETVESNLPETEISVKSNNKIPETISDNKEEEQLKDINEITNTKTEPIKTDIFRNDDKSQDSHEDFEHNNDDVISLGHDDLDYEMRDHLEDECVPSKNNSISSSPNNAVVSEGESVNYKNDDIIDLHDDDTSDEDESRCNKADQQTQNWNTRWLKSSKVSKIMATSRLGNRLREKIKSKKTEQVLREIESPPKTPEPVFESKFEEGSVEQYKEILDREN